MAQVAETKQSKIKIAHFTSDGQLLSELGERLIADPRVAVAELVKNAYDADATKAHVWIEKGEDGMGLHILDDGHGMTEREFLSYWMRIATSSRLQDDRSHRYKRPVTGSKGVGRFAVRFLGYRLHLETVAQTESGALKRLVADFDWEQFRAGEGLDTVDIPYRVLDVKGEVDEGTQLTITHLRDNWDEALLKEVTDEVLDFISPPFAPLRSEIEGTTKQDPGFALLFSPPGEDTQPISATKEILERHIASVKFRVTRKKVRLDYEWRDPLNPDGKPVTRDFDYSVAGPNLVGDLTGEIRWYPKRAGVFKGLPNMDGRKATKWLREHGGVRIIDRNFRVPPYGEPGNDWLQLSETKASNVRDGWGSEITEFFFPYEKREREERMDPLLNIPGNHQLVGAVYVQSHRPDPTDIKDAEKELLQPMMDRQGFLANRGFDQLKRIVRAAVELFGVIDRQERTRRDVQRAQEQTRTTRREIQNAIRDVQANRNITVREKKRLVASYQTIDKRVEEMDTAHQQARKAVESLSLLGVLAGFMTHEATVMLRATKRMLDRWKALPAKKRDEDIQDLMAATEDAWTHIKSHIDYTRMYVLHVREAKIEPFPTRPQVDVITSQLEHVWEPRHVEVVNRVPEDLTTASVPLSVFSGVLLNLFTNALKSVLSVTAKKQRKVLITATDTNRGQVLRVLDSGVGIPVELRERIFDPLFTTTDEEGPLGSGMGLGLHIVKRMLDEFGAKISVVDAQEDNYTTCIEVRFKS